MRLVATASLCALLAACAPPPKPLPPAPPPPDSEPAPRGPLPADVHPEAYRVELEVDPAKPTYRGTVSIDVTLDRPRRSIWLHSRGPRLTSVTVMREGSASLTAPLEAIGESGLVAVRMEQPLPAGRATLTFPFEADFGTHLTGLYKAEAGGAPYVFTQFEPISAREAFPCFDEPRFKTPFDVKLRVPKEQVAIANTRIATERDLESGLHEVTFTTTEKLPTYLIAFAVGPLDVVPAPPMAPSAIRRTPLALGGAAARGRGPDLAFALRETPALLSYLEQYFGIAYPYDKLDILALPDFGAGAMENAGAITFRDTLLLVRPDAPEQQRRSLTYVDAHELAHQWFGNLVTMPWWDDIWLNEAFATWMGGRAVASVHPEYEPELGALSATHGAMEVDSRSSARKIRQPIESDHDIENAFDAITYSKGGAVLSMFERYLGADEFQSGLRVYMDRFRFGSATARDLVRTLAEVTKQNQVEAAFFSFLEQPGVPLLQVHADCTSRPVALEIEQSRYLPLGTSVLGDHRWQVPFCARYGSGPQGKEECALLTEKKTRVPLDTNFCPQWVMPNAGASGYYHWALEDAALESLVAHRASLTTAEAMSLASNVSAAFKAGKLEPARVVATQKLLVQSSNRHVMETALRTFGLIRELLDDASLPAFRAEMSKLLRPSFQKLGIFPKTAQPKGEEKLRRASLTRAMFNLAEDAQVMKELALEGDKLLAPVGDKPSKLPSELIELALSASIRAGGAAQFEKAYEQLFASNEGLTRARLLNALASVRDPQLSERVLLLALDPRLRVNERLLPLFGQIGQVEMRNRAFDWLRTHHEALAGQLGAHGGNDVVATTANFCSEDKAREVEAFFSPNVAKIPGGPRELAMSLESIRSCAALATAVGDKTRALYAPKGALKR